MVSSFPEGYVVGMKHMETFHEPYLLQPSNIFLRCGAGRSVGGATTWRDLSGGMDHEPENVRTP